MSGGWSACYARIDDYRRLASGRGGGAGCECGNLVAILRCLHEGGIGTLMGGRLGDRVLGEEWQLSSSCVAAIGVRD